MDEEVFRLGRFNFEITNVDDAVPDAHPAPAAGRNSLITKALPQDLHETTLGMLVGLHGGPILISASRERGGTVHGIMVGNGSARPRRTDFDYWS